MIYKESDHILWCAQDGPGLSLVVSGPSLDAQTALAWIPHLKAMLRQRQNRSLGPVFGMNREGVGASLCLSEWVFLLVGVKITMHLAAPHL